MSPNPTRIFAIAKRALVAAGLMAIALAASCARGPQGYEGENGTSPTQTQNSCEVQEEEAKKEAPDQTGLGHRLLFYLPNRLLDVLDIVRLRVRVGPGAALGLRATTAADLYLGSYATLYAGLPGPRLRKLPKSPLGVETFAGVGVSLANASANGPFGPGYSSTEIGASLHAVLIGLDVALDPLEAADLLGGVVFINLRDDEI